MSSIWAARGMPALVAVTLTGFAGYGVLLPTAPLWAVEGGASAAGAGLVNGVLLLFTVLTQLLVPGMLRRFGWAQVMGAGMLFMGLPALGYLASDQLGPILVLSAVRGVGFGILTVTGSAAVAELVEPARRGAAIGAYGLAVALPNLVLLPLGPWIAQTWGFGWVFALAALPVIGIPAVVRLAHHLPQPPVKGRPMLDATGAASDEADDMGPGKAGVLLLRPTVLLLGVTLCGGALTTFAPQMTDNTVASTLALFAIGATAALARWGAGGLADRFGTHRFMWPLTLLTVVGMLLCAWAVSGEGSSGWVAAGFVVAAALVGVSYGALQNLTLVLAFSVVTRRHMQLASAVWNVGFDAGTGLGSVLVGLLAAGYGFPTALTVAAAVSACTIPLALVRSARPRQTV
ncbi:MAG: MFS transporter [Ornithinimicrobium sp.]